MKSRGSNSYLLYNLPRLGVVALLLAASLYQGTAAAADLTQLRVLFVGSERSNEYVDFLKGHVGTIEIADRISFDPALADKFDVVLLDWPQNEEARLERNAGESPLGKRENWSRPTVLLGSAGLNLACVWQLRGGSGCTCLDPVAYDLKDHPIFESPFHIDRSATIQIETPEAFQDDLDASTISVIPIVDDFKENWRAGWCTYSTAFDIYPDVEFFCGGVNHKTPTAAAIWRQGNLLHFGFQQSPKEMNDTGNKMLLNSIAYISNFSQDRPISITPSVFVGPNARPRSTVAAWLDNPSRASWVEDMVTPELWKTIQAQGDADAKAKWASENTSYFTADANSKLEIDQDLASLEMGFDDPEFLPVVIGELASSDSVVAQRAKKLLTRYVPDGPSSMESASWVKWHEENKAYLFATDYGHYRWYLDPLAKTRGIPTAELRGAKRMDVR